MELTDALAQLPRVFALKPDLDEVTDTDDLDEAMRTADAVLAGGQHRLLRLDEPGSGAHALLVVPAGSVPEIERLATALEHRVTPAG